MRSSPTTKHVHRSRLALRVAATLLLAAGLLVTSAGAIGAAAGACGEYSYGFTGTRLINDGISDSAGPFAIDLPAGTYDITMWSNDNHPSSDYQVEQTNEQWYFMLDNGYQSPPTDDIPADGTAVSNALTGIDIAAATAISVHHVKIGGVNSVNVECVGFTPTIVIAGPATTEQPAIAGPATTTTTIAAAVPPTTSSPKAIVTPTTAVTSTTVAPAAPTTTSAVSVEVLQKVELPEAQLAVTGPQNEPLVIAGVALLALGAACLAAERRTLATQRSSVQW